MKSTLLRTFFEWALITSVLMSAGFFAWYYFNSRAVWKGNIQVAQTEAGIQNNRLLMAQLQHECLEYSKTNADFARFLSAGKSQSSGPAASVPVVKPKAK